ncbi:hypothetical protein AN958_03953 [Leucoagaricus sp. SymC.cos]|nr:hypothetical protein AN958_03953 [Leucoagaricus sp. SymC.cos]
MAATPARGFHWDPQILSPSLLCSPVFDGSTESYISTSSLEYVNAQLVAHGFAPPPGLSLDGLSGTDSDRVVKCLLGMLSQRMEDISRTEELSTKFRTLTYDHERLLAMHRVAKEKVTNSEKEVNLHKTKLTAAMRTLQSTEAAHKQATAELQRTRTSLQGIRATHQQELKKKEKELERMAEKWNKLSDAQTKPASVPAGLKCANIAVVDGTELAGKTPSLLETAFDDAEKARTQLIDEVARLRRLVVKIVNQVQAVLYQVQGFISNKNEEPTEYTVSNLFPIHPPTHAHDILSHILRSLRDVLAALPLHIASSPAPTQTQAPSTTPSTSTSTSTSKPAEANPEETAHLQATIAQLQEEIECSQKQAQIQATQTKELFDNFIASQQKTSTSIAEMSTELMTAPAADAERERLEKIRMELDAEREKFTQATIKLGKERATLEADRNKLLDEKRSWQVQQMLADLPPTPHPHPHPHPQLLSEPSAQSNPRARPRLPKSPRKPTQYSPSKKSPRKPHHKRPSSSNTSATRRATRIFRRPSITPVKSNIIPSYETELIPESSSSELSEECVVDGQLQQNAPPPLPAPSFSLKPSTNILPSFVLPPPSPHASLPRKPLLPPTMSTTIEPLQLAPTPSNDFVLAHLPPPDEESTPFPQMKSYLQVPTQDAIDLVEENAIDNTNLTTPVKRSFPVAKPFAQRMIHAYSPAKPSPLSRILMFGNNSPNTPTSDDSSSSTINAGRHGLEVVREEAGSVEVEEQELPETPQHQQGIEHRISLAAELGVESPPEIVDIGRDVGEEAPLKERKVEVNGRASRASGKPTAAAAAGGAKKPGTGVGAGVKERPKSRGGSESTAVSRSKSTTTGTGRTTSAGGVEKENGVIMSRKTSSSTNATASSTARTTAQRVTKPPVVTKPASGALAAKAKASTKPTATNGAAGAGPRRVPINSAEAPAIRRKS